MPGFVEADKESDADWQRRRDEAMKDAWDVVPGSDVAPAPQADGPLPSSLLTPEGRKAAMDKALDSVPRGEDVQRGVDAHMKDVKATFDRARSSTQLKPRPLGKPRRGTTDATTSP